MDLSDLSLWHLLVLLWAWIDSFIVLCSLVSFLVDDKSVAHVEVAVDYKILVHVDYGVIVADHVYVLLLWTKFTWAILSCLWRNLLTISPSKTMISMTWAKITSEWISRVNCLPDNIHIVLISDLIQCTIQAKVGRVWWLKLWSLSEVHLYLLNIDTLFWWRVIVVDFVLAFFLIVMVVLIVVLNGRLSWCLLIVVVAKTEVFDVVFSIWELVEDVFKVLGIHDIQNKFD